MFIGYYCIGFDFYKIKNYANNLKSSGFLIWELQIDSSYAVSGNGNAATLHAATFQNTCTYTQTTRLYTQTTRDVVTVDHRYVKLSKAW